MMQKVVYLLIINLMIGFSAIAQTGNLENIDIKIRKAGNKIPVELIKGISLLPIEFKPEAMIKRLAKVQFDGSNYYLLNEIDAFTLNLIITSKEGKISRVLNRKGKGPGEYLSINDFNVDPRKKDIWIYDGGNQLFSVYAADLRFIRSFPHNNEYTPGNFLFTPWDPQSIVINSIDIDRKAGKMFNSLSIVKNESEAKVLMNLGEILSSQGGGSFFLQRTTDAIDFWPEYSSDIIRVNEAGCKPVYRISFDEPTVKRGTMIYSSMLPEVFAQCFYESDSYVIIQFMISNKGYDAFYNKRNHLVTTFENPWNTEMNDGPLIRILGFIDNKLVLNASNMDVREVVSQLDPGGNKLVDKMVLEQIDPESQLTNPILIFVELN